MAEVFKRQLKGPNGKDVGTHKCYTVLSECLRE